MTHEEIRAAICSCMARGKPLSASVTAHVQGCQECAHFLDAMLDGERALEGTPGLSPRVLLHMQTQVLAALPLKTRSWWPRALVLLPALAVAAAALLMVAPPGDHVTARGTGAPITSRERVRMLCVEDSGVSADVRSDAPDARLLCHVNRVLGFTVSVDADSRSRYLFLDGEQGSAPRWYHPRPDEMQSIPLPAAPVTDHVIPGVRLAVNHSPGTFRVDAIFSETPLTVDQVRDALTAGTLSNTLPPGSVMQTVELTLQ